MDQITRSLRIEGILVALDLFNDYIQEQAKFLIKLWCEKKG
jgi:hypothetical protein